MGTKVRVTTKSGKALNTANRAGSYSLLVGATGILLYGVTFFSLDLTMISAVLALVFFIMSRGGHTEQRGEAGLTFSCLIFFRVLIWETYIQEYMRGYLFDTELTVQALTVMLILIVALYRVATAPHGSHGHNSVHNEVKNEETEV